MSEQVKTVLDKLNIEDEFVNEFKSASFKEINYDESKKRITVVLKNKTSLSCELYFLLEDKLKKHFANNKLTLVIEVESSNKEYYKDYYLRCLNQIKENNPLIDFFSDRLFTKEDKYLLEVFNKAEEKQAKDFLKQINKKMQLFGFEDNLSTFLNEEKRLSIINNINSDLEVELKQIKTKVKETKSSTGDLIYGYPIKDKAIEIKSIVGEENRVCIEGQVFGYEEFSPRSMDLKIVTLKVTDFTDSIYAKAFLRTEEDLLKFRKNCKEGSFVKLVGRTKYDSYSGGEVVLNISSVAKSKLKKEKRMDNAPRKRVELHAHTQMSQMDGIANAVDLIRTAHSWGHKGIAITDKDSCQSFPEVFREVNKLNKGKTEDRFKVIYGTELLLIEDQVRVVERASDKVMLDTSFVVFDLETTGFNAGAGDSIIEIGAVILKNGKIVDKFSELVNPKKKLVPKITQITGITDAMLKDKDDEETVVKRFLAWAKDLPLVAHNAKFDRSFLEMAVKKYDLAEIENTIIDTLELSRLLDKEYSRHSLSAIVKRYEVEFDEGSHHRAEYDASATALVFHKMMQKLSNQNIVKIKELEKLINAEELYKYGQSYHVNILARNKTGLKNMFKLLSIASTKYLHQGRARILRTVLDDHREGLLIGSSCYESEVFNEAKYKSEEELKDIISFYDYVEVQAPAAYDHLIQTGEFASYKELEDQIAKIIRVTKETGKIILATGDVHHIDDSDKIYREIIVNQKVPGGGRHPLARSNIRSIPSLYLKTTEEMLADFKFLEEDLRTEIVIDNPNNFIDDFFDEIEVIPDTKGVPFAPLIDNSQEITKNLVYDKAYELYGMPLPNNIKERIEQELYGIFKGGFDVIYLISQKLVKKSNDDGYIVGSRGSVGSSLVAFLMGVSEVNPLPAHYLCPSCKLSIFEENGIAFSKNYYSGYDLPDLDCPKCSTKVKMEKEGQDMPFATFLGFKADKVPDIDLNFSGEYQWRAHEYTKELFGIDNAYRAGTTGTVAEKTAFGFVKGYCEDKGLTMRSAEIERLAQGCIGVKRTTGQHPGGIIIVPNYKEIYDFTPYQYPAGDKDSLWRTTHFDYHAIEESLLKLDILGHDDPTVLKILQDYSGIDLTKIDVADEKVISLFTSTDALGVSPEEINCPIGVLGLPEFGTDNTINMLVDTKPTTFGGLVKISGLSHGTDVWAGNASDLIKNEIVPFEEVIACRDEIMLYLIKHGMDNLDAFKIMEFVRKGKASREAEEWEVLSKKMRDAKIPEWYIESCYKIKYMFPKAHACAYVISALRIAWFKVYYPLWYYAAYFSVRTNDFDIEAMIAGTQAIRARIEEIEAKGFEASVKEQGVLTSLKCALEASARKIKFSKVDLYKSESKRFIVDEDVLIPSFNTIEGLGETAANAIVEEREKRPFISIEDLQKRAKVSSTVIEKMRFLGILVDLPESSQLSLF